jgi:hypothetical protein
MDTVFAGFFGGWVAAAALGAVMPAAEAMPRTPTAAR